MLSVPVRRRRTLVALAALLIAALLGGGVSAATPAPRLATPVEENGQLKVCGNRLCNEAGQPIQLRGMSSHGLQWYRECVNDKSLDALATDWKSSVFRLSMYIQEGGYETDPRGFTDMMHELIDQVSAHGMYVIVDWHILNPGDPHYNLERAKTFFSEIAERHADKPNILYEVANEPNGVDWPRIKSYHEQIIPVIREKDPDSVILLGTRGYSSLGMNDGADESEIVDNPVDAENVMYVFHFYAASHGDSYVQGLSRAADRIPVFVTEYGTQHYSGDGDNDLAMSQKYAEVMAEKDIGWTNWNFADGDRSGEVLKPGSCPDGPFAGADVLKEAGVWVREHVISDEA